MLYICPVNGLSLRNTAKTLKMFVCRRSHTPIRVDFWNQKYKPKRVFCRKANVAEFITETKFS